MYVYIIPQVSITMTRSLGDRHCARTCVCTPEITKLIVPAGERVRFILGSDGLFDVVTNDRAVSLTHNIKDPTQVSEKLIKIARHIRESERMKIDDITCIVVDINANNFTPETSNEGCVVC